MDGADGAGRKSNSGCLYFALVRNRSDVANGVALHFNHVYWSSRAAASFGCVHVTRFPWWVARGRGCVERRHGQEECTTSEECKIKLGWNRFHSKMRSPSAEKNVIKRGPHFSGIVSRLCVSMSVSQNNSSAGVEVTAF